MLDAVGLQVQRLASDLESFVLDELFDSVHNKEVAVIVIVAYVSFYSKPQTQHLFVIRKN